MMGKTSIVVGSFYGDEGKGVTTDFLCRQTPGSLVVRFNGGHQAGHTVVADGKRHIFSSFGSGSLRGNPTFYSRFCTVHPRALMNEFHGLAKIGCRPDLTLDEYSMITTPYDIAWNRFLESMNGHGSCGVGFGATIERNSQSLVNLYAKDLLVGLDFNMAMKWVSDYYKQKFSAFENSETSEFHPDNVQLGDFKEAIQEMLGVVKVSSEYDIFQKHRDVVFEGAQGILLDMDHGYFPHVTRSNTTSRNALLMIKDNDLEKPEIFYATRCYQSRHGNGPMTNSQHAHELSLVNNENETNVLNKWQGNFRTTPFDFDEFSKAIKCDSLYSEGCNKNIVVTCMDQVGDRFPVSRSGDLEWMTKNEFLVQMWSRAEQGVVIVGDSPSTDDWNAQ